TVAAGATFAAATANGGSTYGNLTLNGGTFRAAGADQAFGFTKVVTDSAGGAVDFSAATGANVLRIFSSLGITIAGNSTWLGPTGGAARITQFDSADTPIAVSPGVTFTNGLALATLGG